MLEHHPEEYTNLKRAGTVTCIRKPDQKKIEVFCVSRRSPTEQGLEDFMDIRPTE